MGSETELLARIAQDPGKYGGRPCIRHLRIRVSDILEMLAADVKSEEVLARRTTFPQAAA